MKEGNWLEEVEEGDMGSGSILGLTLRTTMTSVRRRLLTCLIYLLFKNNPLILCDLPPPPKFTPVQTKSGIRISKGMTLIRLNYMSSSSTLLFITISQTFTVQKIIFCKILLMKDVYTI